jgi:hypothetical protein
MKPEMWIAIYAAVVATSAFALNFRTWFEKRVRLNLTIIVDAALMGGSKLDDEGGLIALTVINRGGQTTTLTHLVVLKFDNFWRRWRTRPSRSFIIPNPQVAGTGIIPSELDAGKKWTGIARKRPDIVPDLQDGKHYMGVYASNRDRPYLIRIPKPKPSPLPAGTQTM